MEYTNSAHLIARFIRDETGQEFAPAIDVDSGKATAAIKMKLNDNGDSFIITWISEGKEYLTVIDDEGGMEHYPLNETQMKSLRYLYRG